MVGVVRASNGTACRGGFLLVSEYPCVTWLPSLLENPSTVVGGHKSSPQSCPQRLPSLNFIPVKYAVVHIYIYIYVYVYVYADVFIYISTWSGIHIDRRFLLIGGSPHFKEVANYIRDALPEAGPRSKRLLMFLVFPGSFALQDVQGRITQ